MEFDKLDLTDTILQLKELNLKLERLFKKNEPVSETISSESEKVDSEAHTFSENLLEYLEKEARNLDISLSELIRVKCCNKSLTKEDLLLSKIRQVLEEYE